VSRIGLQVLSKRLVMFSTLVALSGCVSFAPSLPEGYTGPKAFLDDSAKVYDRTKADFFVAEKIGDATVENSIVKTTRMNYGRGPSMTVYTVSNTVVAGQPLHVGIKGRTHYAAPILELTHTVYQIRGDVDFTPEVGRHYVVKGELSETHSAVWIEDGESHEVIGRKIEVLGSTALGTFQK